MSTPTLIATLTVVGAVVGWLEHSWLAGAHYLKDGDRRRLTRTPPPILTSAAVAGLFAAAAHLPANTLTPVLLLAAAAPALAWIDWDVHRLPNAILGPLTLAMIIAMAATSAVTGHWHDLLTALAGAGIGLGCGLLLAVLKVGLGAGDIKLLVPLGLAGGWISWTTLMHVLTYALVVNGLLLAALLAVKVISRGRAAMGPGLLLGALVALLLSGCLPAAPAVPAAAGDAQRALAALPVRDADPDDGYTRSWFGPKYSDDLSADIPSARNGCDQRNDIRRRDALTKTIRPGTRGCVVAQGTYRDPYTGTVVDQSHTQLEHVVSLHAGYVTGGRYLSAQARRDLGGDPLNLLIVSSSANASKRESDTWQPPNREFRCPLVARQIAVKTKYGLWVTPAERRHMARILSGCPGQQLPTPAAVAPPTLRP